MKILVTGGAGYLGSHLVRMLLDRGDEVTVLDKLCYGDAGVRDLRGRAGFSLVTGDICNIGDVVKAIQGRDAVVALAAIVGDPACNLSETDTLNTNYESTKVLVEISKYYKIQRLVFTSSCSVYGANSNLELNEGSKLEPISLYARTRIMSEQVLFKEAESMPFVILRLATLFGHSPRMRFDLVINHLTARAVNEGRIQIYGGDQWRPFVHVQDAARAILAVLGAEEGQVRSEIFNVGANGLNFKIARLPDFFLPIFKDLRVEQHPSMEDARDYRVNFDKIAALTGFKPQKSIADGIREMAEAFRSGQIRDFRDDVYYNVKYLYR
ncbi:MAG: hypothetical protein A3G34_11685 [Candidatus Lindowbacteria bacterium RIFCSPLOWO2_12_FULL_62_27]|nr:MAG: hypothetical protein A3I06_02250 [Candidatus Lindowbacteria bacterium RIFCSPLOWO2_02_FULL_62_12]OGH60913.1 MAG: hypothetical protein A3G34_11685 [Candidatus Lindowbacteria bacterium RIFCSPLOWO2_12_FULL_62_27]